MIFSKSPTPWDETLPRLPSLFQRSHRAVAAHRLKCLHSRFMSFALLRIERQQLLTPQQDLPTHTQKRKRRTCELLEGTQSDGDRIDRYPRTQLMHTIFLSHTGVKSTRDANIASYPNAVSRTLLGVVSSNDAYVRQLSLEKAGTQAQRLYPVETSY